MKDISFQQISLFPDMESSGKERTADSSGQLSAIEDSRPHVTITWNLWHGCSRKVSPGCLNCYMYRRDEEYGKDPTNVHKTASFNLPVRKYRSGPYRGLYRIPAGSTIYTCFTSDFFIDAADDWRPEAWNMIRQRPDCTFFMITKRPERILQSLPEDWGEGWDHVHISCTCENQYWTDRRLPIYLQLPIRHKSITHEPMLEAIDIRKYLKEYSAARNPDGSRVLDSVSCGGESDRKPGSVTTAGSSTPMSSAWNTACPFISIRPERSCRSWCRTGRAAMSQRSLKSRESTSMSKPGRPGWIMGEGWRCRSA